MKSLLARSVFIGALCLTLTVPAWATAGTKAPTAKEQRVEKKAVHKRSEEIKKLQEALKTKGEDPGAIDGILGKKTRAAIKAFQEANGLKASGRLDEQTAEKLGVEKPNQLAKTEKK